MATKTDPIQQLSSPALLEKIQDRAQEYISHGQSWEAKKLADQIEIKVRATPNLAIGNPEIYDQYTSIILQLKLASLSVQPNNNFLRLIKSNIVDVFKLGLDINEAMTLKMYSTPSSVWFEFSKEIVSALKSCSQRIGQRPLNLAGTEEPKAPTVTNWLIDYDRTYNVEKHSDLEQSQYLAQNSNARSLNSQEKSWLQSLIRLYDNLKPIPSSMFVQPASPSVSTEPVSEPKKDPVRDPIAPPLSRPPRDSIRTMPPLNTPLNEDDQVEPAVPTMPPLPQFGRPAIPTRPSYGPPSQEPALPNDLISPSQETFSAPTTSLPAPPQEPRLNGNIVDLKNQPPGQ